MRKQSANGWEWKLSTLEAERLTKRAESAGAASISSCNCATQFLATCRAITGTSIQRSEKSVKKICIANSCCTHPGAIKELDERLRIVWQSFNPICHHARTPADNRQDDDLCCLPNGHTPLQVSLCCAALSKQDNFAHPVMGPAVGERVAHFGVALLVEAGDLAVGAGVLHLHHLQLQRRSAAVPDRQATEGAAQGRQRLLMQINKCELHGVTGELQKMSAYQRNSSSFKRSERPSVMSSKRQPLAQKTFPEHCGSRHNALERVMYHLLSEIHILTHRCSSQFAASRCTCVASPSLQSRAKSLALPTQLAHHYYRSNVTGQRTRS